MADCNEFILKNPDGTVQRGEVSKADIGPYNFDDEYTASKITVNRNEIQDTGYVEEESHLWFEDRNGDLQFGGVLRNVVYKSGGTANLVVDSWERILLEREPIDYIAFSERRDSSIIESLLSDSDKVEPGNIETVSYGISLEFTDRTYADAIRRVVEVGGGQLKYRPDGEVDYQASLGSDKTNTTLTPSNQNITFSKTDKLNETRTTHLWMVGDGIRVEVEADNYESSERKRWEINTEYSNVDDADRLTKVGKSILSKQDKDNKRVRAKIKDEDVELGDRYHIKYPEQDLDLNMTVTEVSHIYSQNGLVHDVVFDSATFDPFSINYEGDPTAWMQQRSSQSARGLTKSAPSTPNEWSKQIDGAGSGTIDPRIHLEPVTNGVRSYWATRRIDPDNGSKDGRLQCLKVADGTQVWDFTTGSLGEPTGLGMVGNLLYLATSDGTLLLMDAESGSILNKVDTGLDLTDEHDHLSVDGDIIIVAGDNGGLKRFNMNSERLEEEWSASTNIGNVTGQPAVSEDYVYVSNSSPQIYCFLKADGTEVWSNTSGISGIDTLSPPSYWKNRIYVTGKDFNSADAADNGIAELHASTGSQQWASDWDRPESSVGRFDDEADVPMTDQALSFLKGKYDLPKDTKLAFVKDADGIAAYLTEGVEDDDNLNAGDLLHTASLSGTPVQHLSGYGERIAAILDNGTVEEWSRVSGETTSRTTGLTGLITTSLTAGAYSIQVGVDRKDAQDTDDYASAKTWVDEEKAKSSTTDSSDEDTTDDGSVKDGSGTKIGYVSTDESHSSFYDYSNAEAHHSWEKSNVTTVFVHYSETLDSYAIIITHNDGGGGDTTYEAETSFSNSVSYILKDDPDTDSYSSTSMEQTWNGGKTDGAAISAPIGGTITLSFGQIDGTYSTPGSARLYTNSGWVTYDAYDGNESITLDFTDF